MKEANFAPNGGRPLIGVVNAGSSSLKIAIYEGDDRVLKGEVSGIGTLPVATAYAADGTAITPPDFGSDPPAAADDALLALLPWVQERLGGRRLAALGHRVVHGGTRHSRPELVTPELLAELESLISLAPLHQRHNLAPIRAALALRPGLLQVACFDTAFHRTAPEVAQAFALPHALHAQGLRRYGFHGLSYEYIASVLPERAPKIAKARVIVAHLGNGASLCALKAGKSVASTMSFTALDGLPMGTRCGQLDPGVVLYLLRQKNMSLDEVEDLLYKRSGMLGLSSISSDFRELLASSDPRARFAIEVFCYQVIRHIGSLVAALGGVDAVVFTAGVGENAPPIRAAICSGCRWLGLILDQEANLHNAMRISSPGSRVAAYVIPTDENLMIASHTRALLKRNVRKSLYA